MQTVVKQRINYEGGGVLTNLCREVTSFASDSVRSYSDTDSSMVCVVILFSFDTLHIPGHVVSLWG